MNELQFGKGDVNPTLTLIVYSDKEQTVVKDISAASTKAFLIKKPDETVVSVPATFVTDGTDGKLIATLTSAVLTLEKLYEVQVSLGGTPWSGTSSSFFFIVRETLVAP